VSIENLLCARCVRRKGGRIDMTVHAGIDGILITIRKVLTEKFSVSPSAIEDHISVADLGINSIAVLELARAITEEFGVDVRTSMIYEGPSIQELAVKVHSMVTGAGQIGR
jgi:acyl carrier protein